MAQDVGSKLAGAMNKSPSMAGLRRVSPGIFRDANGQLVTSAGKPIPRQPQQPQQQSPQQAMPRPLVQQPQQMGQPLGQQVNPGYQPGINPDMDRFKQEYDAAVNYQPDFKESQSPNDMGFLARKKYQDMAQRRQQMINSPIGKWFASQNQPNLGAGAGVSGVGAGAPGNPIGSGMSKEQYDEMIRNMQMRGQPK